MARLARSVATWAGRTFGLDFRSLACLRAALGLVIVADAVLRTRDLALMFAPDGMFPLATLREFFGDGWSWSLGFVVDATWWGTALVALEGLAGAALAVGLGTRVASCLAWVAVVSVLRRTAPATNAGDEWLACLLFWGMFLPWGKTWSIDARRRRRCPWVGSGPACCSPATVALVLQIAAVYLGAALSKWNPTWLSGDAVGCALSIHDHGTAWGDALARHPAVCRLLTWAVLGIEVAAPCLLVATGRPAVRIALVAIFLAFHAATAMLMSLGLFAFVGMAAWLALVPTAWWDSWLAPARLPAQTAAPLPAAGPRSGAWLESATVVAAIGVAGAAFLHANTPLRAVPLPMPLTAAVRATCLGQDWGMFGEVRCQRQWVFGRGVLADGRAVDVLRTGRPLEATLPAGGFTSLPHHRWHKLFWELPEPDRRAFAPGVAAALARAWNHSHPPEEQLVALELRAVRLLDERAGGTRHELLLASWPPRDGAGQGSLDRWLEERTPR